MMILIALFAAVQNPPDRWRIHEWGTFTVLQDEAGKSIGWINTEDEPVPAFVHRLSDDLLVRVDDLAPVYFQGAPRCHPDVSVRLETPVIYFHPPAGAMLPVKVDLRVDFQGGWLTEHYPEAVAGAPGLESEGFEFGRLTPATRGFLEWKGLEVGREGAFPETKDPVWLSPRNVKAAAVTTPDGQSERFLFYRGVGNFEVPLRVKRDGNVLSLHAAQVLPKLWYVDIREDGRSAFRTLGAGDTRTPARFDESDYAATKLDDLRAVMLAGLISDGLHLDEAQALLKTWEASYFRAHGTRLFFLLPKAWIDQVLPLKASIPAVVVRSMVGRIELVTPAQRACLKRIAEGTSKGSGWYQEWSRKDPTAWLRYLDKRQEGNLAALRKEKVEIPDDYRAYLELGRFRNALVLEELKARPTPGLQGFVDDYDLREAFVRGK